MADDKNDDTINSGILGLGGAPVPKAPGDPTTEHDAESVAQRRARMREGEAEAEAKRREETTTGGPGATGIDMGAGGEGTGLKPK